MGFKMTSLIPKPFFATKTARGLMPPESDDAAGGATAWNAHRRQTTSVSPQPKVIIAQCNNLARFFSPELIYKGQR
jgi:hypothetical protein